MNRTENMEACNKCDSCLSFNSSRSYNIHELDAASNNSVDDIRNLIDQVRIPPQMGTKSVYIIDEVHMLSTSAFNAFLKTLEEPPAHAIFILATTEKHKIIPTILSRCQIFDFQRIKIKDIVNHLSSISKQEENSYEDDALTIIAQKADGGLRDALSMYDQIISFTGKSITYQAVIDNLNVLDYDYYFRVTDYLLKTEIAPSMILFDDILNKGFDGRNFINGLAGHFRDLLVCMDPGTLHLLETGETIQAKYLQQAKQCSPLFIFQAIELINRYDLQYNGSRNKRLHVEILLMLLCQIMAEKKKPEPAVINNVTPTTAAKIQSNNHNTTIIHEAAPNLTANTKKASVEPLRFSISDAKNSDKTEKKEEVSDNTIQKPTEQVISNEVFLKAWQNIVLRLEKEKPSLFSILEKKVPTWENPKVKLIVSSKLHKDTITEEINYLRKSIDEVGGIKHIELFIEIDESIKEEGTKIYSSRDKFNHLRSKNSALDLLTQEFNLDIE